MTATRHRIKTKIQRVKTSFEGLDKPRKKFTFEDFAPYLVHVLGVMHHCESEVVGAGGRLKRIFCSQCNALAIKAGEVCAVIGNGYGKIITRDQLG